MPERKDQQSSSTDTIMAIAGGVIALTLLFAYKPGILTTPWAALKSFETALLLHLPLDRSALRDLDFMRDWFHRHSAGSIGLNQMWLAADAVGQIYKIPLSIGLAIIGAARLFRREYRRRHTVDTLLQQESKLWPQTRIMTKHRPDLEKNPGQGKWAMGEKPVAFARKHGIIKEDNSFDEQAAFTAFEQQMGPRWSGVRGLTDVERQVFAILAARITEDSSLETELKTILALAYAEQGALEKANQRATEVAQALEQHESVQILIKRHAWVRTVLPMMLFAGRTTGVLSTTDFLWLKIHDRGLWYMLNNVGRRVAWVEIAGVWAHWLAERVIERPIEIPMVDQAVAALEEHLRTSGNIEE